MATSRSGFVRVTTTDVYKGSDAIYGPKYEYVARKDRSGLVLLVGLIIAGAMVFAVLHAAELKAMLGM